MHSLDLPASRVRVPMEAKQALAARRVVEITSHGKTTFVMLHPDDFAEIRSILERRHHGIPVAIEDLLDDDDFALLRDLRSDDGGVGMTIGPSWA